MSGNWFTRWLERKGRLRVIPDRDGIRDYMYRYYLIFGRSNSLNADDNRLFNLFLHNILLSDEEVYHDHPWWYIALILKGGYYEHTPNGVFWRGPGSIRFAKANSLHYVKLPQDEPWFGVPNLRRPNKDETWTLFFHGPRQRKWGFIDPISKSWVDWETWIKARRASALA